MQTLNADDAFRPRLDVAQWRMLAAYLTEHRLRGGDVLIHHRDMDRVMYLLESGTLRVFVDHPRPGHTRLSLLRPGAVVGEAGLFSDQPRMANVEAMTSCVVWPVIFGRC